MCLFIENVGVTKVEIRGFEEVFGLFGTQRFELFGKLGIILSFE